MRWEQTWEVRKADEHAEGRGRRRLFRIRGIRRRANQIRLVAAVDRVDRVVNGTLHHRQAQRRDVGRLSSSRGRCDRVPLDRGVAGGLPARRGRQQRPDGYEQHDGCHARHRFRLCMCTSSLDPSKLGGRGHWDYGGGRRMRREAAIPSNGMLGLLTTPSDDGQLQKSPSRRSITLEASDVEPLRERSTGSASRSRSCTRPGAARPGRRCRPPPNRTSPARARAAAPRRARRQPSARARVDTRRSSGGEGAPRRDGARRSARAGRTARLAQRIFPPLLEAGGLAAALRSAAVSIGIPASVEVATGASDPPRSCERSTSCLEVLEHAGDGARASVTVREEQGRSLRRRRRRRGLLRCWCQLGCRT